MPELKPVENPPPWRDVRVLRWVVQIAVLAGTLGLAAWLLSNVRTNLETSGLPTGFGFLQTDFRAAIPGIEDAAEFPIWKAFLAGYSNTLRVIIVGIPACTILGIMIGIARLSNNGMVRLFGTLYVEAFRNVPVLIWIFFMHFALVLPSLPQIQDVEGGGLFVVTNRGIGMPWINPEAGRWLFAGFILLGFVAWYFVAAWRRRVNERTGHPAHGGWFGLGAFVLFVALGHFVSGDALLLETADIDGRLIAGGMTVDVAYTSLTAALVLYTASHVAEIVRGAIQAIHTGQFEAADAVALTTFQKYRYVILPQAFRIMIPPLASQYLNITKNSSLAVAVSYVEITAIFQRVSNNATPAVQALIILMVGYLSFSLSISLVANFFNRRLALETR